MRARAITIAGLLALAGCATGGDGEAASTERFVTQLAEIRGDFQPSFSVQDLATGTDVVVTGVLRAPQPGREVYASEDAPAPYAVTATFELADVEVLGGDDPGVLDGSYVVEIPQAMEPDDDRVARAVGIEEVQRALPDGQEVLLFLDEWDPAGNGMVVEGEQEGTTYLVPRVQGLLLEGSDGRLASNVDLVPSLEDVSFDAAVSRARDDLDAAPAGPTTTAP